MRILIIKPSSLGDVVHALPTAGRLRHRFTEARISWLVNDALVSVLRGCPVIDEVIEFPRQRFGQWRHALQFVRFLADLRARRFDLAVDLQGLLRSGVIARATGASRRVGLSDAREGARLFYTETVPVGPAHAVDRYLRAAAHLGCPDGPVEFPLGRAEADRLHVDALFAVQSAAESARRRGVRAAIGNRQSKIALNPSARWTTKLWGDDKFAALARRLPGGRLVFTGSAADAPRIDRIITAAGVGDTARNLAGQTDLAQLAEVFRRCAVVISNDSGPMHLAVAVGTPVVALFGASDPSLTGPYGARSMVLQSGIPCSPCLADQCTHRPRMECMEKITVEQVLAAVGRLV